MWPFPRPERRSPHSISHGNAERNTNGSSSRFLERLLGAPSRVFVRGLEFISAFKRPGYVGAPLIHPPKKKQKKKKQKKKKKKI